MKTLDSNENDSDVLLLKVLATRSYMFVKSPGDSLGMKIGHKRVESSGESIMVNRSCLVFVGFLEMNLCMLDNTIERQCIYSKGYNHNTWPSSSTQKAKNWRIGGVLLTL